MATMKATHTVTLDSLLDEADADGMARYHAAQRQGDADRDAEAMYLGAQLARLLACDSDVVVSIGEEVAWALYQQSQQQRQRQGA